MSVTLTCSACGTEVVRQRARVPAYCSPACRQASYRDRGGKAKSRSGGTHVSSVRLYDLRTLAECRRAILDIERRVPTYRTGRRIDEDGNIGFTRDGFKGRVYQVKSRRAYRTTIVAQWCMVTERHRQLG